MTEEAGAVALAVEEAKEQDVVDEVAEEKNHNVRRLHSAQSSGMESSVLRFKDVNFVIGKGEKQKNILTDVTGTVKWGHVLAIMGPSGAGKVSINTHGSQFHSHWLASASFVLLITILHQRYTALHVSYLCILTRLPFHSSTIRLL
jgi:ABC-type transport system involved in cytochrome bd biosynthesis fused ATPase/permease subunit